MKLDLGPLKEILSDLKRQINLEKQRTPFDPKKIEAYCWIFGSPDYVFLQGNIYKIHNLEQKAVKEGQAKNTHKLENLIVMENL